MNTHLKLGEHYLVELSDCNLALLYAPDNALGVFFHAIRASGLTVLAESAHKFAPHGFSAYTLLAESHASVHAWPEYGYCAIDVFTCNLQLDLDPLFKRLQHDFGAGQMTITLVDRQARWEGQAAGRSEPVVEDEAGPAPAVGVEYRPRLERRRRDYIDDRAWAEFLDFSRELPTPCLVMNLDVIRRNYRALAQNFPYAKVYYAVKANPALRVIECLRDLGACFDISSTYELDHLLALGIAPTRLSYGNTIKKQVEIQHAYRQGVRLFATDSLADVQHLAQFAPGSQVFVRLAVDGGQTADWPLSHKFGCSPTQAYHLLVEARKLGLEPYGLSFHVGSQQRDIAQWDAAVTQVQQLFTALQGEQGIRLKMMNLGGGFPANYLEPARPLPDYAAAIQRSICENFGDPFPEIIVEPGRSLVAEAGILVTEIVLMSRKDQPPAARWVYLDAGKFNGLIETLGEAIKYPIFTERDDLAMQEEREEVVLAGPTCDSMDVMYQDYKYKLPRQVAIGDRLYWLSAGAYTSSYSSVEFNGFPPLATHFQPDQTAARSLASRPAANGAAVQRMDDGLAPASTTPATSYFSPKLEVKSSPQKGGAGVYARQPIPEGEIVMIWGGRIITEAECDRVPEENRRSIVQVEEALYIVTPGGPEPVDYINHSCNANVGLQGQVVLVAMRPIAEGEEVCFDYAMTDGGPYDEFECSCGAPNCRGWITGNDWKKPELWKQYAGFFSPYLQRRIDRLKAGLGDVSAGAVEVTDELFGPSEKVRQSRNGLLKKGCPEG